MGEFDFLMKSPLKILLGRPQEKHGLKTYRR